MKKVIAILISIIMVLVCVSCTRIPDSKINTEPEDSTTPETTTLEPEYYTSEKVYTFMCAENRLRVSMYITYSAPTNTYTFVTKFIPEPGVEKYRGIVMVNDDAIRSDWYPGEPTGAEVTVTDDHKELVVERHIVEDINNARVTVMTAIITNGTVEEFTTNFYLKDVTNYGISFRVEPAEPTGFDY